MDPFIHPGAADRGRRSIRLRAYDYSSPGSYFVTIVVNDRRCLLGEVVDGTMRCNDAGRMVQATWEEIPAFYPGVQIDTFQVMPNHVHGVIVLTGERPGRTQGFGPGS